MAGPEMAARSARAFTRRRRTTHSSLLTTHYSLLTPHSSLLTTQYSLPTPHYSLLTTLTTHYSLLTLLTTLTTHYPLLAFHQAPYPLRLASREMVGRIKGTDWNKRVCTRITDRDECCAALDSSDRPCVPAVVRFTSVVGTPVCLDAATAASEDHRSQIAACPLRSDALGAARARVTLDNQVACSSLTDRHACCGAIDGGTTAFRAGYACVPSSTIFQNGYRCETPLTPLVLLTRTHCALLATHY